MTGRLGAVVLAGGRSSRFGRDKLAEPLGDGRPLLHHAIDGVRAVAPDIDVVVVASPDASPPVPSGVRLVRDATSFEGPLMGVATGLAALAPEVERVIVVGGDMPTLVPAVLRLLLDALGGADAAILDQGERVRPLPMAVRRSAASGRTTAILATAERRLRALPEALGAALIPEGRWRTVDPIGETLRDVDVEAHLPPD